MPRLVASPMFEIHSLKIGELLIPEEGALLLDPVHVWLVTDGRTRILVDGGMPEIAEVTRRESGPLSRRLRRHPAR